MSEIRYTLPVMALRGLTVLPEMIIHFDVTRKKSIAALEAAMTEQQNIFLVTQRDIDVEEPGEDDVYKYGTIAMIKQIVKMPKTNTVRVLVEGKFRARVEAYLQMDPYVIGEVMILEDDENVDMLQEEAMVRYLLGLLDTYSANNKQISAEFVKKLQKEKNITKLVNQLCSEIPMDYEERQKFLETDNIHQRFDLLAAQLNKDIEILKITRDIQEKVRQRVDKNQKDYILREQIRVIREELGENNTQTEAEEFEEQLKKLKASKAVKEKIQKEIDRFKASAGNSSETGMVRGYIETVLDLPWDKMSKDNKDIDKAERVLKEDHYGLTKVKERIIEYLSVRLLTNKGDAPILCLVGPPGTGKTSIAKSVARALNKEYVRISLGGVHDEAEIRGHRKTYIGAMPGRIVMALKQAKVKNPVILFDEVDKIGSDYKGDPFAALLEVLDSEQNSHFRDNYVEIPVDLSEVLFIATANSVSTIPRPLLDRMEMIEINSYTENEKMHIAKKHLLPKQLERNGLTKKQLSISDKAMEKLILSYTREAGVRNLERRIGDLCRKAARIVLSKDGKNNVKVTEKNIEKFLGKPRYTYDSANEKPEIGIVRGLAWTSVGGDTLSIEVNVLPGKGHFELTGQLGDVMKESAKAGISYVRSMISKYNVEKEFFENHDIHIHIPEGAVPKDGPSAGITMATAVFSAITEIPVRSDVAMTGEITLRGRVLPIGGLKEKILAAKLAKIQTVIVPKKNEKDIDELEKEITEGIEIVFAETMEDVLKTALCH
ncbi:MAG: endopeptidase La [Clostridiales bacterium]|nr:endopeptidase La [Clostridiales bacterium]MDY3747572.1 endopeptidase La [Lachnospiraceae bacterium]